MEVYYYGNLSSNTLRRHHDLLSSSLRSAVRQDKLLQSPMDKVEPPRAKQKEATYYRPEELKRLYTLIEGYPLELCAKLAGSLGLRREEICGLKWECIDFQRQLLSVKEARTAFGATIASFQGVPLFDIGKALGHSTPATTGKIYTHLVDHTHEDTLLKVSDALK